ncbi:MAG TPA: hypothetical protein VFW96_13490, partial [Thermomicrobiales bacterium]|nr:hypothetical protein [Thermomicrobiales bacterium]
ASQAPFAYALDNPLSNGDPSGHDCYSFDSGGEANCNGIPEFPPGPSSGGGSDNLNGDAPSPPPPPILQDLGDPCYVVTGSAQANEDRRGATPEEVALATTLRGMTNADGSRMYDVIARGWVNDTAFEGIPDLRINDRDWELKTLAPGGNAQERVKRRTQDALRDNFKGRTDARIIIDARQTNLTRAEAQGAIDWLLANPAAFQRAVEVRILIRENGRDAEVRWTRAP